MKKQITLLLLSLLFVGILSAQERDCSTMENLEYRKQLDPQLEARMQQIEDFTRQRIQENGTQESITGNIIIIPVVVHIIYNTAQENISQAQIQSQIDVMNEDFRRTNTDADNRWSQAADTEIQFCLATVDENGNATTGITRKSSSITAWGTNDAMKSSSQGGVDSWNTSEYLNMWVCNMGGGILGYAQFPGGSAATDGVVMGPQYFGSSAKGTGFYLSAPFDLGRTTTHEVGHFLNLRHIWGDGNCTADDFVSDTPSSDAPNYGCDTTHVSCGSTDMVQNYMDYSDDGCMNLYTAGQKARMRAVLDAGGSRRSLALSDKCGGTTPPIPTCNDGIQNGDETGVDCGGSSCAPCQTGCSDNEVIVTITFDQYPEETSWAIVTDGGTTVASESYTTSNAIGSTVTETLCLPNDCYTFTINDTYGDGICCTYGSGSYTVTGSDGEIKSGGSFTSSEATDFCLGTTPPPAPTCTDGIQNGDETGIDCGGSTCAPCTVDPTCTDGIQNGDETGVDCGGSSCAPCSSGCSDNEVTLAITFDNYPEETSWSLVTDGGTTVASGSYSTANADGSTVTETVCLPNDCYTFTINDAYGDGICCTYGSGSYTLTGPSGNIASGGSFTSFEATDFCFGNTPPAPTCTDGIQNGDETGIDCGGSTCAPCATGGTTLLHEGFFESGLDGWADGGSDCFRYNGSRSYEGSYSIRLRDNSGTASAMTSETFDLRAYNQVEFTFYFYANSMENGEDFWVRYYNGSSWSTVATYASGTNFNNGTFYSATVTLDSSAVNFASNSQFRVQCDASANADQVYIDQVTITGISGARAINTRSGLEMLRTGPQGSNSGDFLMTPTVTRGDITINLASYNVNSSYRVLNLLGQTVKTGILKDGRLNVSELKAGVYLLEVSDEEEKIVKKFVKQ
jgi:hypothetical protein